MKSAQQWFNDYAVSHQNETNQLIHFICVPLIFFSVIGLFMSIPTGLIENTLDLHNPLIENWAVVFGALSLVFYIRLGFWYFAQMLFFLLIAIIGNFWLGNNVNLLLASIIIFVAAWIGQFYGHKVEGKKPSFIKDLQFLLIGPLWVLQKIGNKK
jgi:uncharacterized membrane protein YGL010W